MPQSKHLLCCLAVLAMVSAQSTSLPTEINADSTSAIRTSYTLTGTSIAAATGSPPSVASTTIHAVSTVVTPIPTTSSSTTSTSSIQLSIPAIAGIAAGGSLLLLATFLLLTFTCLKRRRSHSERSTCPDSEMPYNPTARPLPRRPSSAATLVDPPAQGYIHSKGSLEHAPAAVALHHSKSAKSFKSSRSTILERVSEEAANDFTFDFGVLPRLEGAPPLEPVVAQVNEDAFQKLVMDKSLPASPEHEIPMSVLDMENYQTDDYRPRSSVYSTVTGQVQRDTHGGPTARVIQSYF